MKRILVTRPAYRAPNLVRGASRALDLKTGGRALPETTSTSGMDAALAAVMALSAEDRQQVLDRLALDEQNSSAVKNPRDLEVWAEAVHGAVKARAGIELSRPLLKRGLGSRSAWVPVARLRADLEASTSALSAVEWVALARLLSDLLVTHVLRIAHRSGAPLGVKLVTQSAPQVPALFENAFPGYAASGMCGLVLSRVLAHTGVRT